MKTCKGFTLIEIVCVIILLGLLTPLVGIKGQEAISRAHLNKVVNEIVIGIEESKIYAVQTGKQYNLYCFSNRVLLRQGITYRRKICIPEGITIPDNITGKWIRFKGSFAPVRAGTIELHCKKLNKRVRITVGVATGKVRVYEESL